jgi:hypothetical protein
MAIEADDVASCDRVQTHRVDRHDGSTAVRVQSEEIV